MRKYLKIMVLFSCSAFLLGCTATAKQDKLRAENRAAYQLDGSYLQEGTTADNRESTKTQPVQIPGSEAEKEKSNFQKLKSINTNTFIRSDVPDPSLAFDDNDEIKVAVDNLQLKDFLHYALGDLLKVSYVLSEGAKTDEQSVTLNIQQAVSSRRLFSLIEDVLTQRDYTLVKKDDLYYVLSRDESSASNQTVFGIGRKPEDIPKTSRDIYQIVPFKYGFNASLNMVLRQVAGVSSAVADSTQGVYYLLGKRANILQAIEFIEMIDKPNEVSRNVSFVQLTYVSTSEFVANIEPLMANDGISVGLDKAKGTNVVIVPLEQRNALVIFAKQPSFISRLAYWAKQIDQPSQSDDESYFIYTPTYARAVDLEESIGPLIGNLISNNQTSSAQTTKSSTRNNRNSTKSTPRTGQSSGNILVVDERSNSLIFFTTGKKYQTLLPLLKKLDLQPKQVLLEVTIAEVTLKDEFKKGVEFALTKGNYDVTTKGAFGLDSIGGLSYALTGTNGSLNLDLSQDDSYVNVLSRPSIVVRDGVTASINVGTDIPVVGQTTTDPISGDRQTTSIQYRKTGVQLSVTPTVNSQGVVIMKIDQEISNTVDGGISTGGSPSIFERSINTEVVADSGQTIILGGLISENRTDSSSQVPVLGDLPFLGHLFQSQNDLKDKTELVVLVTPKIIHRNNEWLDIKNKLDQSLTNISVFDNK